MSCYAAQFATTIFSNTVLQCWNNVVAIPNNVATMLRHCVALKIVVMNNIIVLCNITLRACCSGLVSLAEKELTTQLKLLWETKRWSDFEGAVKYKSYLDK